MAHVMQKVLEMPPKWSSRVRLLGAPWGSGEPGRVVLRLLGDGFGFTLGSVGVIFYSLLGKVRFCDSDAPLQRNSCFSRSRRPCWSHLVPKASPERPKVASKRQGREVRAVEFGRSVRFCCRSYGNGRNPAGKRIRAEAKVSVTDKTYD